MVSIMLVVAIVMNLLRSSSVSCKGDPEVNMNITEIIRYNGYPCEDHTVYTADGYILSLQRIPRGKFSAHQQRVQKPVALLQHGLLDSAHTWIMNLPNQSLGYILADKGFDVWMANSRGSTYSRKHVRLDPNSRKFWEFSWDEMAKYDLPVCIHYILNITNSTRLSYVGHSQGTEIAFAQFSQDLELASHISSFTALAPVVTTQFIGWIPYILLKTISTFSFLIDWFYHGEFFPQSRIVKYIGSMLCSRSWMSGLCGHMIFMLSGYNYPNFNYTRLPVILAHYPAGTSVQNMKHYSQATSSHKFQMYDHGHNSNMDKYGTPTPPLYNVSKLNVSLGIFNGGKDLLADPRDVQKLTKLVRKIIKMEKFFPNYTHLDFTWGLDAARVLYPRVIDFMKSHI